MTRRFTRGMIIGGIIGAAASMMMEPGMNGRSRRRMMKKSRNMMRSTGNLISDVMDMFR